MKVMAKIEIFTHEGHLMDVVIHRDFPFFNPFVMLSDFRYEIRSKFEIPSLTSRNPRDLLPIFGFDMFFSGI